MKKRLTSAILTFALGAVSAVLALEPLPFEAPPVGFDVRQDGVRYGDAKEVRYFSTTADCERNAIVLTPPRYDDPENASKTYPVLFLLHGIGGDEREWFGGAPLEILGNLAAKGAAKECLVVLPNGRVRHKNVEKEPPFFSVEHFREFDAFLDEMKNDLKPFVEKNWRVASGRENWAIAGLSMGGRSALHVGLKLNGDFSAIGAFEPAVGLLPYPTEPGLFEKTSLTVPKSTGASEKKKTFLMIVKGSRDSVVGDWPKIYAETLTANGDAPEYYLLDGGHEFKVWKESLYLFASKIFVDSSDAERAVVIFLSGAVESRGKSRIIYRNDVEL